MPPGLLVAGLLLAHAAIHVAFVAPPPPATADGPAWPFATDRSWLVTRLGLDPALMRGLALALVAVTIAGYALAALAALGVVPTAIWPTAIAVGDIDGDTDLDVAVSIFTSNTVSVGRNDGDDMTMKGDSSVNYD